LINNKPVKKSYKLKPNDIIQIENLERYLDSSFLEELPFVEIPVILEKEDYLVLNKPKGVLSHPNSIWDLSAPSVVAFLYQKYKDLPTIGNFIRA
jgi:23S rRNA-/tRNA-specific pseudouridylate synthase